MVRMLRNNLIDPLTRELNRVSLDSRGFGTAHAGIIPEGCSRTDNGKKEPPS